MYLVRCGSILTLSQHLVVISFEFVIKRIYWHFPIKGILIIQMKLSLPNVPINCYESDDGFVHRISGFSIKIPTVIYLCCYSRI